MTKSEYRKKARALFDRPYSVKALLNALSANKEFLESNVVLSYKAIKGEIDLSILEEIYKDKLFLYPVVEGTDMYFTISEKYKVNEWGIKEPVGDEIDFEHALMLVPGLLFDKSRYRLGRGKGFYDRYISKNRERLYTLGVCKKDQLEETLPVDSFDQRLDALIILPEMDESHVLLS